MKPDFPTADDYSTEKAQFSAMNIVDIRSLQANVTESYKNQVLLDINKDCMRLAVIEGEYRWHQHPSSDELFLVVEGELQIDFASGEQVSLTEWQSIVVPTGTVHRTRAVGRTVNITYEEQGARTVFVDPPPNSSVKPNPLRSST